MAKNPEAEGREDQRLTADEWASWALLGNPHYPRVPITLKELHERVSLCIKRAVTEGLGSGQ